MERARQFTYTHQHPSSHVTNQGRKEGRHVELRGRHNTPSTRTEGAPAIFANTRTRTWDPALWYHVKLHALANATKSPNWWKGLGNSLIHINRLQNMHFCLSYLGLNIKIDSKEPEKKVAVRRRRRLSAPAGEEDRVPPPGKNLARRHRRRKLPAAAGEESCPKPPELEQLAGRGSWHKGTWHKIIRPTDMYKFGYVFGTRCTMYLVQMIAIHAVGLYRNNTNQNHQLESRARMDSGNRSWLR
jgi:hypothetical protein